MMRMGTVHLGGAGVWGPGGTHYETGDRGLVTGGGGLRKDRRCMGDR